MTMSKTPVPNLLSKSHSVMYDEKHTLHTQSAISKIFDSVKTGTCIMTVYNKICNKTCNK